MSSSNESQIDVTDFVLNYSKANSEDRRVIVRMVQEFAAKAFSEEATDEADEAVDILQQIAHGVPDITWSEAIAITTAIATIKKPTPELIDLLITNLAGSRTKWIRVAAADELGKLRQEAHKALPALMECVLPEDLLTFDVRRHAFEAITAIGSTEVVKELVASKMQPPEKYGSFLVKEDLGTDVLGDIWGDNPELALRYVVAALKVQYDQPRPEAAAAWLRERAPAIPENSKISELLKKQLVDQLKSWKLRENYRPKVRQLLEETLSLLEGLTTIQTWIKWIEAGDPTSLAQAEIQAQQLRSDPNAVYYLVSEFERWEDEHRESTQLGEILVEASSEKELLARRAEDPKLLSKTENDRLNRWLTDLSARFAGFAKENRACEATEINRRLTEMEKTYNVSLDVRRRIVKQLTEMSDYSRFFEGKLYEGELNGREDGQPTIQQVSNTKPQQWDLDTYNSKIREQLKKHVIPVFGRKLPKESDADIRANMTRTLANIGGRESVETLVQAIIGEERKQDRRQRLLDDYYLRPSRDRSEEAAQMLQDALVQAKRTMQVLRNLNIALFCVGLGMIIAGVLAVIFGKEDPQRLAGVFALFGGVAGIIASFITDPLDRIQNAMSRLVQLEAAFTSFVWELNLNSTYIQSQYVAKGILSDDDIARTVGRLQEAMSLTLNMVQTYAVQQVQLKETRIEGISSQQTEGNTVIWLYGQNLKGDSSKILVNHKPLEAQTDRWTDTEVRFTLPAQIANEGADLWVSLRIDGKDTNAMACKVGRSDTSSPADASTSKSGSASTTSL